MRTADLNCRPTTKWLNLQNKIKIPGDIWFDTYNKALTALGATTILVMGFVSLRTLKESTWYATPPFTAILINVMSSENGVIFKGSVTPGYSYN